MSRLGLRSQNTSSRREEFQTDLKFADEKWKENEVEEDVDSDSCLEDDADSDKGDNQHSNSSDDDMPETVSFIAGRQTALQKVKEAVQQISNDKQRVKEKRRLLNDRNKEAKRRRLDSLQEARLSDDILAEVCSQPEKLKVKPITEQEPSMDSSQEDSPSESESDDEVDINPEFIPLDYDRFGGVTVATEKEMSTKQKSLAESALEFRNKSLYSNRIQRETGKHRLSNITKRKARFS